MLASTVQFSSYGRSRLPGSSPARRGGWCDAGTVQGRALARARSLRTQQRAWHPPSRTEGFRSPGDDPPVEVLPTAARAGCQVVDVPLVSTASPSELETGGGPARAGSTVLLRKEVIQPHLPVRLPCYDLVPIASPTFDGSLHKGWATGFGCCRLS